MNAKRLFVTIKGVREAIHFEILFRKHFNRRIERGVIAMVEKKMAYL